MMGYTPNVAARSLVLKHSKLIGLVSTDMANSVVTEFVTGLRAQLDRHGYHLLVMGMGYEQSAQLKVVNDLLGRMPDALVI